MIRNRNAKNWSRVKQSSRMRVRRTEYKLMGLGCGMVWRHLPTQNAVSVRHLTLAANCSTAFTPGVVCNPDSTPRCDLACDEMNRPSALINGGLLQGVSRCKVVWIEIMVSCSGSVSAPLPINQWCTPDAGLPNVRTVTSKRSRLNYCLDFGDNLHFSHSGFCMLSSVSLNFHLPQSSVSPALPLLLGPSVMTENMPRLRQRMRCRRGSTRR